MLIKSLNKIIARTAAILMAVLLQACTVTPAPLPNDPNYAPVMHSTPKHAPTNLGGIYQEHYSMSLFEDRRANRIGDIVTVVLNERTVSKKKAETEISKDAGVNFNEGLVLGDLLSMGDYSLETNVSQNRAFTGESESDQSNSLLGSIAVTVADILPNGLLVVRGEKWMTLTSGEEFIRIKGLLRPEDIGADNSVASTKLADARITYSGTGEFADSNRQGWASRFFNSSYWPF